MAQGTGGENVDVALEDMVRGDRGGGAGLRVGLDDLKGLFQP